MKIVLHDWSDKECVKNTPSIQKTSSAGGRILLVKYLVPDPETPHFSKLFDIHMMCALTGKERTEKEYAALLEKAGFRYVQTHYPPSKSIGVVEGIKQ